MVDFDRFVPSKQHRRCLWMIENLLQIVFLVHLSRILKCTIVITRCPSSVCPSLVRPSLTFHIFDFFSETAKQNSTKLNRKQDLNVLYKFVFSGRSEDQDGRPGLWLAETFSTSPLKLLNGIQRNLTGSKISTSFTKFVFFGPIGKTRWPPWPLIGWDFFDFSFENRCTEFNETWQEARSQRPLPNLCFSGRSEKQDGRPGLWLADWQRNFRLLLWNCWTEFNESWHEARSQRPLPSLCFSGRSEKQDGRPSLWLAETFSTSSLKPLKGIQRNLTGSKISTSLPSLWFSGWWVNKISALADLSKWWHIVLRCLC